MCYHKMGITEHAGNEMNEIPETLKKMIWSHTALISKSKISGLKGL